MADIRDDWPLWLAALLGVGSLAFTKKYGIDNYYLAPLIGKKPRCVLSIYTVPKATGWEQTLNVYDALSCRLLSPGSTSDKTGLYAFADQAGIARHGWGYQYLTNKNQANKELGRLEEAIAKYEIAMYWANPEIQFNQSKDPAATAAYFVEQFRDRFPGVGLAWNGFGGGKWFSEDFVKMWDVWSPMTYATCPPTVAKKIRKLAAVADSYSLGGKWGPTVRCGEAWKKATDQGYKNCTSWGYAYGPDGLLALNQELRFPWVNFWHGAIGSRSTLVKGTNNNGTLNPSVPDLVQMLQGKEVAGALGAGLV